MYFEAAMTEMIHTASFARFLAFTAHASFRHTLTGSLCFALNNDTSTMTKMHFG